MQFALGDTSAFQGPRMLSADLEAGTKQGWLLPAVQRSKDHSSMEEAEPAPLLLVLNVLLQETLLLGFVACLLLPRIVITAP